MASDEARAFAAANRAFVTAPAGCGKTHLIAEAVSCGGNGRQLILTHTHAGVRSIRNKLKKLQVSERLFHVDTIDGIAFRYASSFPCISGCKVLQPANADWPDVHGGATKTFGVRAIRRVLARSFAGVYVDEYQDCTISQHEMILALGEAFHNTRIAGDPLQGVFDFRAGSVDWKAHVDSCFTRLLTLSEPWRWKDKNERLGKWLLRIRDTLWNGGVIDLSVNYITQVKSSPSVPHATLWKLRNAIEDQSIVAIHKTNEQCHTFAQMQGNHGFVILEPVECNDLFKAVQQFDSLAGPKLASVFIRFCKSCAANLPGMAASLLSKLDRGQIPARLPSCPDFIPHLNEVVVTGAPSSMLGIMKVFAKAPKSRVYRHELWREMEKVLAEKVVTPERTLFDIAWVIRQAARHMGRQAPRYALGTTLLVKGLEFDHAVILDADHLDARNLYVAMTMGARSLTIFSNRKELKVKPAFPRLPLLDGLG